MYAIRIIESAILLLFCFLDLMAAFDAVRANRSKAAWAGGIIGVLGLGLVYTMWL